MSAKVVEFHGVSRRYGNLQALDGVSFELVPGYVYGLVGSNGAGKTTLIKHILGLLKPQQGTVRVFGQDPVRNPVEVLRKIGYLSEHRDLPDWMRVRDFMWYSQAFYPGWDWNYCNELLHAFGLDTSKKIKNLSQGMRAQVALIAAVAHHPLFLLLDEPSTGLDAVVRQDILNATIRAVADNGRAALFSSHLLDEVERMSDYVLMIDRGKLILSGTVDAIRQQHPVFHIRLDWEDHPGSWNGVLAAHGQGRQWQLICHGQQNQLQQSLQAQGVQVLQASTASLEQIFVARAGRNSHSIQRELICSL